MSFRQVDVNNSVGWLSKGWEIFSKNPGVWILMALITFVIFVLLMFIPLLGQLAGAILGTLLYAGMIHAASEQDAGRNIDLNHLFRAFQDSSKFSPLIILSLIAVAGAVLSLVLGFLFVGGAIGAAAIGGATNSGGLAVGALLGGGLLWVLLSMVIKLAVSALMFFAVPRIMLEGGDPIAAAKDSLNAVLANIGPMLVFGLIVIVLSIIAAIPFFLGWLVLMPVLAGANYAAYQNVYGSVITLPPTEPTAPTPPSEPPAV